MKGYDAEAEIDDQDAERLSALYASARARGLPEPVYRELEPDERDIIRRLRAQDAPVVVVAASVGG
jgi:alpha-beta hydrolase superfamily lysophospholipase